MHVVSSIALIQETYEHALQNELFYNKSSKVKIYL